MRTLPNRIQSNQNIKYIILFIFELYSIRFQYTNQIILIKMTNIPTFSGQKTDMVIGFSVVGLAKNTPWVMNWSNFWSIFSTLKIEKQASGKQVQRSSGWSKFKIFLWQMKVQPKILSATQTWPPMTSISTGNDVIINGLIFT